MTDDKSINASDRLETKVLRVKKHSAMGFTEANMRASISNLDYYARNAGKVGINPMHSLETGIK